MKKVLLVFLLLLCSGTVMARKSADRAAARAAREKAFEEEMFSALDMKLFHDRQMVQGTILQVSSAQTSDGEARVKPTQAVLTERDSNVLENAMDSKQITYKVTPELMKKSEKAPFEAFKDLVKTAEVAKMTKDEVAEIGTVDKQAIPEMMQMITESGNDLGARRVSVTYGQ